MRGLILFAILWLTGCSTAPLAGFLDAVNPSTGPKRDMPKLPAPSFDEPTRR